MQLERKFHVEPNIFLLAKNYVQTRRVAFFDFFRNCAYGFVKTQEERGFYPHLIVHEDGELEAFCNCRYVGPRRVCAHAFALYLKLVGWPMTQTNLSEVFDRYPLADFFKTMGRQKIRGALHKHTNPSLNLEHSPIDSRLTDLWGFTQYREAVAKRDHKAFETAKSKVRSTSEIQMLNRNMPSTKVMFEESPLYGLCKLFYFLEHFEDLQIEVVLDQDHQVRLEIGCAGDVFFTWLMPVEDFLKGIRKQWSFWEEKLAFEVRRQSVGLVYRMAFDADSHLLIEPRILIDETQHCSPKELLVPNAKALYHHESLGYFNVATGLSLFEMTYSEPEVHQVDRQAVGRFLKQHKDILQTLDRTLMDEALFGEVVLERFDRFRLQLLDYQDEGFTFDIEATLGEQKLDRAALVTLFDGKGRYRKVGVKLFDSGGYDGVFLRTLFKTTDALLGIGDLFRILALFRERLDISGNDLTEKILDNLRNFQTPETPSLDATNLNLRPYQTLGYQWLYFLKSFNLGGLLCDQMGLGKTHQGMALIAAVLADDPNSRILVTAPASVLFHWRDKLATFLPKVTTGIHHGSDRDILRLLDKVQVVISSYGTLRNDVEHLEDQVFNLVLFDEIQYLKNKHTKAHRALARLSARCRVGLTGTPVENDISELKNLMDLVFPGYLGDDIPFRRFFIDPIVKQGSDSAKERLRGMVKPFTLRRSKTEVLTDLPEKTEDLRAFPLSDYELQLYREIKGKGRAEFESAGGEPKVMHIFQLIDKLKQVCCHPALYFKTDHYQEYPGSKWRIFTELLTEALDSGEKVVVFTQYLGMIDLFSKHLKQLGVEFACITGATRNREAQQQRFQEDPDCKVFLGTIMAAGVGIDLTAASILIHYDRWWNAAREEQATDRIHRIGQKRAVQVYKFMAIETVEERINKIIESKRGLLEDVVSFDNDQTAKSFSVEELLEILA